MPDYRCQMLDERGDVLFPADIVAETLDDALRHAFDILRMSNRASSASRQVYAFEVWAGSSRLFPEPLTAGRDAHVPAKQGGQGWPR
jgi:hypothetical protein